MLFAVVLVVVGIYNFQKRKPTNNVALIEQKLLSFYFGISSFMAEGFSLSSFCIYGLEVVDGWLVGWLVAWFAGKKKKNRWMGMFILVYTLARYFYIILLAASISAFLSRFSINYRFKYVSLISLRCQLLYFLLLFQEEANTKCEMKTDFHIYINICCKMVSVLERSF